MKETLKLVMQNKAAEIAAAAEAVAAHTRDWQMIEQFLSNRLEEFHLTYTQQKKMERYQYMYNQVVSGRYTDTEVINQSCKFFKIKPAQAYEDLSASKEIFSTVLNINKRFELNLALEINKKYQRMCVELGDMKSLAKFEKNRSDLIKQIEELEDNRGELFEGHTFELTFNPELLGAAPITQKDMKDLLDQINERRNKKVKTDMFEELDYTETPPET